VKIPMQDAGARQYDVEVADGTPVDVAVASASKELGRELRPVEKPSKSAYAYNQAAKGFSGSAGMMGVPIDFAMGSLRGLDRFGRNLVRRAKGEPLDEEQPYRRDFQNKIQEGWNRLLATRDVPAPSTASEWLLGRPAEFLGASALPSAKTVATATRPIVAGLTELTSNFAGGVGSKAGEETGGALAKGVARVTGAGKEGQEKAEGVGRGAGGLLGGLGFGGGTAMAIPRVGSTVVDYAKKQLIPKLTDKGEIEKVAESAFTKHFRESLISDPRYKANIEQALKTRQEIPGFDPDLSMAAGTPAVRALQTHAETESPAASARGVEKREGAVRALEDYRDANFAQGERSLQELSADEVNVAERALAGQQAQIDARMASLKDKVRSGNFGPEDGRELELLKREQYKTALARSDVIYKEVYQLADRIGYQGSLDEAMSYIRQYQRDLKRVAQKDPAVIGDLSQAIKKAALDTKSAAMKELYGAEKMPDGITAFVAKNGGFSKADLGGEFPDIGQTPTFAQRGKDYSFYLQHNGPTAKTADEMLLRLKQDGYLAENASINDMIAAVEDEIRAGDHVYFKQSDWDAAAQITQRRAAEKAEDLGTQGVEFNAGAQYPSGFGPMHSILKRIRQEQRFYGSRSTDEARLAMKPLNELEQIVTKAIGTAGEDVGSRLAQADALFKSNVADPFYHGVAAQSFNERGLIENVARRMMGKGEEGAKNFKEVYGESERAQDLLWNGVLDALASRVGQREVGSKLVQSFYESNKKFIDQFPQIRTRLLTVDKVAQGLEERTIALAEQRRAVNRDLISTLVGRNDPEKYLVSIVQNEAAMKNVAAWARKNPEMGQQILRSYVDGIMAGGDPAALMLANEKTLKPVFDAVGKDQWKKAMTLLTGETIRKRGVAEPVFKPEVITDPMKVLTGTATPGLFSRIRGAVYRQISPEYLVVDVGGKYFFRIKQDQAREAINAALYDPKLIDNILALDHQLALPKPPWDKIKATLAEMKEHYANHAVRVGIVEANAIQEDPAERKEKKERDRSMRGYWNTIEHRAAGGPVVPGRPYVVGENGPEIVVPTQPGTVVPGGGVPGGMTGVRGLLAQVDPMGLAAKNRYKEAAGASIDASEPAAREVSINRGGQEVMPVPPNIEALAKLLVDTHRAKNIEDARFMAKHMVERR
jgi:hypothetical protein